jgi:hypothetical protein
MKLKTKKNKALSINYRLSTSGFTIFFAMLVGSLALSVGFAIYDLTVREIDLSAAATQSQYAIYAADTGVECALYWDSKYGGTGSAFGTSTASTWGTAANCNGQDIVTHGTPASTFALPTSGWNAWDTSQKNSSAATTTFTLAIPNDSTPAQTYCAVVQVGKATVNNILFTTIISRGYNSCDTTGVGPARLERALQVSY